MPVTAPSVIVTTADQLRDLIAEAVADGIRRAQQPNGRAWLSIGQAAELLGRDRSTIHRWATGGLIPADAMRRVGSRTLFRADWCASAA